MPERHARSRSMPARVKAFTETVPSSKASCNYFMKMIYYFEIFTGETGCMVDAWRSGPLQDQLVVTGPASFLNSIQV